MKVKAYIAMILMGTLTLLMSLNGYAQENLNIWAVAEEVEQEADEITLEIKTDGRSTDGLLVVTYDASALNVEETDVVWADEVAMSSVNAEEAGTLKMAYVAEEPIEKGTLATIRFEVIDGTVVSENMLLEGEAHDAEGNLLLVGMADAENLPTTEESEKDDTGEDDKSAGASDEATNTGDPAQTWLYLMIGAAAAAGLGLLLKLQSKGGYRSE